VEDKRSVAKVEWFTVPLVGAAGWVGVMHSFLTVTVEDPHSSHCYVIEKAAVAETEDEENNMRLKNGVHISHWADVAPTISNDSIYTLTAVDMKSKFGGKPILMTDLRDVAVDLGQYEVANCNCHHMALAVYNFCARDYAQVSHMPNEVLTWVAGVLEFVGVDVGHSESAPLQSQSESVEGTPVLHHQRDPKPVGIGASVSWTGEPMSAEHGLGEDEIRSCVGEPNMVEFALPDSVLTSALQLHGVRFHCP